VGVLDEQHTRSVRKLLQGPRVDQPLLGSDKHRNHRLLLLHLPQDLKDKPGLTPASGRLNRYDRRAVGARKPINKRREILPAPDQVSPVMETAPFV
jgi:hypothetical protein